MTLAELGPCDILHVRATVVKILLQKAWGNICFPNDLGAAVWSPACGSSVCSSCSLNPSWLEMEANLLLLDLRMDLRAVIPEVATRFFAFSFDKSGEILD